VKGELMKKKHMKKKHTSPKYELSAHDPTFVKKIEAARRGMQKYRNALIKLAQ
jgi:hypothetical protein